VRSDTPRLHKKPRTTGRQGVGFKKFEGPRAGVRSIEELRREAREEGLCKDMARKEEEDRNLRRASLCTLHHAV